MNGWRTNLGREDKIKRGFVLFFGFYDRPAAKNRVGSVFLIAGEKELGCKLRRFFIRPYFYMDMRRACAISFGADGF